MVISFSNVGMDSLVMTFFLPSTAKCGILCHLFLQEVKINLSVCFMKLHTLEHMGERRYSTMYS